ncbi:MAG TPA: N-acetyltransferase [Terriglobales bacterium]|jgi:ribosomal protein S18 acetylase RimI-like enzyme
MEILDLRHFTSADLRPLMEDETGVWSRLLAWDYSGSAEMILRYVDSKILPGYAAVDRGRIFGYAFFVYEGNKGVIGDLFVTGKNGSRTSGQEVEVQLLTHVIETLQQSPGIHRVEAQLLVHEAGEVARPFLEQGFQRHPRLFMVQSLAVERPLVPLPKDIEIRRWSEQDYQSAAAVITAAYRGHVDSEINDQYRTLSGALRFLNNIVRFPGCGTFDADSSFVVTHKSLKSVIGVILCSRVRHDVGHVTQVCVLPDYRSHRIGEALLAHTARALQRRNFSSLSLTVTAANERAVALYKRLGFELQRIFDAFVWEG